MVHRLAPTISSLSSTHPHKLTHAQDSQNSQTKESGKLNGIQKPLRSDPHSRYTHTASSKDKHH